MKLLVAYSLLVALCVFGIWRAMRAKPDVEYWKTDLPRFKKWFNIEDYPVEFVYSPRHGGIVLRVQMDHWSMPMTYTTLDGTTIPLVLDRSGEYLGEAVR
jgi:hypothetical protein